MSRERLELGSGESSLLAEDHASFHRVEPTFLLILRVLDGRKDVEAELLR